MAESVIGDRIRELRRRRGLTQEELAENAGLSTQVVAKIEQGGSARMETLHSLARALGVVTMWFVAAGTPEPQEESLSDLVLADMRSAIHPPIGITGQPLFGMTSDGAPDLGRLRHAVENVARAYHGDRYDDLGGLMPSLVRSAHHHVDAFDTGPDRIEALRLRSDITGLAGRYLIQIRMHDLALIALHDSLRDAIEIGDTPLAAAAISSQAWAMMRQGRLCEVEDLCANAANEIEPRMSTATPDQLSGWGWLLLRAGAAAVRNNRAEEAREYVAVARTAGARLQREHDNLSGHKSFGPVSAGVMGPEIENLAGEPGAAIRLAAEIPQGKDTRPTEISTWNRHLLDVASANVRVGAPDRATEIMTGLRLEQPGWLRNQQYARDVTREILGTRARMPTEEQRALADFMDVVG